jgi:hypothetical protein
MKFFFNPSLITIIITFILLPISATAMQNNLLYSPQNLIAMHHAQCLVTNMHIQIEHKNYRKQLKSHTNKLVNHKRNSAHNLLKNSFICLILSISFVFNFKAYKSISKSKIRLIGLGFTDLLSIGLLLNDFFHYQKIHHEILAFKQIRHELLELNTGQKTG